MGNSSRAATFAAPAARDGMAAEQATAQGSAPHAAGPAPAAEATPSWHGLDMYNDCLDNDDRDDYSRGSVMQEAGGQQRQHLVKEEWLGAPSLPRHQAQPQAGGVSGQHSAGPSGLAGNAGIAGRPTADDAPPQQGTVLLAPASATRQHSRQEDVRLAATQLQCGDEEAQTGGEEVEAAAEPDHTPEGPSSAAGAGSASQPASEAAPRRAADSAGTPTKPHAFKDGPYNQMRRFTTLCLGLFGRGGLHIPNTSNPHAATLARQLTSQLGKAVVGDLKDGRDEYSRLAHLLSTCTGTKVGRQQALDFFGMGSRGWRCKPDWVVLARAGLYPAAWQLPLVPSAVQEVQRFQAAARRPPQGVSLWQTVVGKRVAAACRPAGEWFEGAIVDTKEKEASRVKIRFDDGDEGWFGLDGGVVFLGKRAELDQQMEPPAGRAGKRKQRAPQRVVVAAATRPQVPEAPAASKGDSGEEEDEDEDEDEEDEEDEEEEEEEAGGSGGGRGATGIAAGRRPCTRGAKALKRQKKEEPRKEQQRKRHCPLPAGPEPAAPTGLEGSATTAVAAARGALSPAGTQPARGEQQLQQGAGSAAGATRPGRARAAGEAVVPPRAPGLGELRQRKLQEALACIQRVFAGQPGEELQALHRLELVGVGGEALREVLEGWEGHSAAQRRELFDAVALTADVGDWARLEARLRRALQLVQ